MAQTLKLGCVDRNSPPDEWGPYFSRFHEYAMGGQQKFRGEKDDEWIRPRTLPGGEVRKLQTLLRALGFYPIGDVDGVFGYRTLSSVRLFQEYVRSIEGEQDIGIPDGVVGPKTRAHLDRWQTGGLRSLWQTISYDRPSAEHQYWLKALSLFQGANIRKLASRIVELVNAYSGASDTAKVADWRFDPKDIHLIGIRRQEWRSTQERKNDDLFVLLVNGMAFSFYGSTDPNPSMSKRPDEPYLVRGQHRYRFGWHKLDNLSRVYRALRPRSSGVLVSRDFTRDDALTDEDLAGGLSANTTINIHWSGSGTTNWSAGCQVIAGARYANVQSTLVNCRGFAAVSYGDLPARTRGAYNVLLDLMTVFVPSIDVRNGSTVYYTVMYERDLAIEINPGRTLVAESLEAVPGLSAIQREELKQSISVGSLAAKLV
jgi:hypothetical protein